MMRSLLSPSTLPDADAVGALRPWRRVVGRGAAGAVLAALAACATDPNAPGRAWYEPYRMEVVQGNVVTRETAQQLQPGYTRDQVRTLLGTPLLTDIFHANRWDYVFTIQRQGAAPQQRRVTVFFDGDRMTRFEAGELPSERDFVASIDVRKPPSKPARLELSDDELRAIPLPAAKALSAAQAASGPVRAYPPLEPATR